MNLNATLATLLDRADGQRVSVGVVRHQLQLLGFFPSIGELTDALASAGGVFASGEWHGLTYREGGLEALRKRLMRRWNRVLEATGNAENLAPDKWGGIVADGRPLKTREMTALENESHAVGIRATIAAAYQAKLGKYYWGNDWSSYHPIDKAIVERRLETGESHRELASHFHMDASVVKRALRLHEGRAGWRGRKGTNDDPKGRGKRQRWT